MEYKYFRKLQKKYKQTPELKVTESSPDLPPFLASAAHNPCSLYDLNIYMSLIPEIPSSPSVPPVSVVQERPQGPCFLHDDKYALHGKILLIVVVGSFFIFLVSLVLLPRLIRCIRGSELQPDASTASGSEAVLGRGQDKSPFSTRLA